MRVLPLLRLRRRTDHIVSCFFFGNNIPVHDDDDNRLSILALVFAKRSKNGECLIVQFALSKRFSLDTMRSIDLLIY